MLVESRKLGRIGAQVVFALTVGVVALLSGCEQKATSAIKIEDQVVSPKGDAADKEKVEAFLQEKDQEVQKLSTQLASYLAGMIAIDQSQSTIQQGLQVPALVYNGKPLNNDHSIPEKLSKQNGNGAVATIFVKTGEEFVRISSSLKRGDADNASSSEDRVTGSTLNHTHPAYSACKAGNAYSGTATLFGRIYSTKYTPIGDKDGKVIGIQFVGLEITPDVIMLKRTLSVS